MFFKKKDPVCGMKEEKGSGFSKHGRWFCSEECVGKYENAKKGKGGGGHGCC